MPRPVAQQIKSWSYSRWKTWFECPRKARYKFIDKLKEPGSKVMDRGTTIHKMAEHAALGTAPTRNDEAWKTLNEAEYQRIHAALAAKKLPSELHAFEDEFKQVRKLKPEAELELAYTADWIKTGWRDWNNAWVRIKVDLLLPPTKTRKQVVIVDHKTGKVKEDYEEQVELYAIAGLIEYPQADAVRGELWYIDHGIIKPEGEGEGVYARDQLAQLQAKWADRVRPLLADKAFVTKPGNACRYCHFRKSNGGPCEW